MAPLPPDPLDPANTKAGESYFVDGKRYIFCIECRTGVPAGNNNSQENYHGHLKSKKRCQENRRRRDREAREKEAAKTLKATRSIASFFKPQPTASLAPSLSASTAAGLSAVPMVRIPSPSPSITLPQKTTPTIPSAADTPYSVIQVDSFLLDTDISSGSLQLLTSQTRAPSVCSTDVSEKEASGSECPVAGVSASRQLNGDKEVNSRSGAEEGDTGNDENWERVVSAVISELGEDTTG